ncbi:MAG: protein kinase [Acidobacteriota bacterium]
MAVATQKRFVGPYEILGRLGEGGMGKVYRAHDTRLNRSVAAKRLHVDHPASQAQAARFRREARLTAQLNHPSIVQVYDVLKDGEADWLIMELVDGVTLRERLSDGRLAADELIHFGSQIAEGLAAAHAAGVIHRDLKADNIMLSRDGQAKIFDFGIAKPLFAGNDLTDSGILIGSLRSLSPEQVQGETITPSSDLFSLGILLYEMASRENPFAAKSPVRTLQRIVEEKPAPLDALAPDLSPGLVRLIEDLLEKDPATRPPSAADVVDRFATLHNVPDDRAAPSPGSRLRARHVAWALTVFVTVLLATMIAFTWPRPLGMILDHAGYLGPETHPKVPDLPSLVVLPFDPRNPNDNHGLSDGLAADLIADLSRSPHLFVIAPSSAFTYRDRAVRIDLVGRELGVRYVVEGSVELDGEQLLVSAQLIEAQTGEELWNQRFAHPVDELHTLRADITEAILRRLELPTETGRPAPTDSFTAYRAFLRGRAALHHHHRRALDEARRHVLDAVSMDPEFAEAYALLGATYGIERSQLWSFDDRLLERERRLAQRALELDPTVADAFLGLAHYDLIEGAFDSALDHAEAALALDPNHPTGHRFRASALAGLGHDLDALEALNHALRLDPRAPSLAWSTLGMINVRLGREKEAMTTWQRLRAAHTDLIHPRLFLLYSHVERGELDTARALAAEILDINPDLTSELAARHLGNLLGDDGRQELERRTMLRDAGLP